MQPPTAITLSVCTPAVLLQGLLLGLQLAGGSTEVPNQDTMDYWMKVRGLGGGTEAMKLPVATAATGRMHNQQSLMLD
jgi:hypothetical protein